MPQYLDIQTWNRKDHFHFFKDFDRPFFNICTHTDITGLRAFTKSKNISFFLASLFLATKAANAVEPFRYRLRDNKVLIYDLIHCGSTVLLKNEAFGFCYFEYLSDFEAFIAQATRELASTLEDTTKLDPKDERDDLLHFSVIPWISFTSFAHASKPRKTDSVPKIVFGKYFDEGGHLKLPVSVEVHHALMDGLHVGRFFEAFQEALHDLLRS